MDSLCLLELVFKRLFGSFQLLDFIGQPVLHVVTTQLDIRSVSAVLETRLCQLARVDFGADGINQASNVIF